MSRDEFGESGASSGRRVQARSAGVLLPPVPSSPSTPSGSGSVCPVTSAYSAMSLARRSAWRRRAASCAGNRRGLISAACCGSGVGIRRDGQCALERRAIEGHSRAGWPEERCRGDRLQWQLVTALLDGTPAFVKSLPAWKATDENTLVAYEMNGAALPHWNGFPARIVVPGWSATYWMKQVAEHSRVVAAAGQLLDEYRLSNSELANSPSSIDSHRRNRPPRHRSPRSSSIPLIATNLSAGAAFPGRPTA